MDSCRTLEVQCIINARDSEQAHIPHALTLLDNAAQNEWLCLAKVMGNRTENYNRIMVIIGYTR